MKSVATLDSESRLELPEEAKDWFPAGSHFAVSKRGDTVILKQITGLAEHFRKVEAAGNDDEMTWEEIDAEIRSYRREKAAKAGRS